MFGVMEGRESRRAMGSLELIVSLLYDAVDTCHHRSVKTDTTEQHKK